MSSVAIAERKENIERKLTALAGVAVTLTIRGDREFTVSAEGNQEANLQKLAQVFGTSVETSFSYDAEIDYSCLFIEVK